MNSALLNKLIQSSQGLQASGDRTKELITIKKGIIVQSPQACEQCFIKQTNPILSRPSGIRWWKEWKEKKDPLMPVEYHMHALPQSSLPVSSFLSCWGGGGGGRGMECCWTYKNSFVQVLIECLVWGHTTCSCWWLSLTIALYLRNTKLVRSELSMCQNAQEPYTFPNEKNARGGCCGVLCWGGGGGGIV